MCQYIAAVCLLVILAGGILFMSMVLQAIVDRSSWQENYTRYEAQITDVPALKKRVDEFVSPQLFFHGTVYQNKRLRFPEDIAVTNKGVIYTGLHDQTIVALTGSCLCMSTIGSYPGSGRIYGLSMTSDESTLYYAAERGLFSVNLSTKKFKHIKLKGVEIGNLNSVAIDNENQVLYLTDSGPISFKFSSKIVLLSKTNGKIIKYDLKTKKAEILVEKIAFPNGIVYHQKTKSIIYSEFNRNRIWKYSLKKRKQTILVQNLLGMPDNLKISYDTGDLLVAIVMPRDSLTQFIKDKPNLRKLMMYVSERLAFELTTKIAGGLRVDIQSGKIKEHIFGKTQKIEAVSTFYEKNGSLYFSSVFVPRIAIVDKALLPKPKKTKKKKKVKKQEAEL